MTKEDIEGVRSPVMMVCVGQCLLEPTLCCPLKGLPQKTISFSLTKYASKGTNIYKPKVSNMRSRSILMFHTVSRLDNVPPRSLY